MANWDPVYLHRVYNIAYCVLIGVTAFSIGARIYVRIYLRGFLFSVRSWHWSDILLCISWLGFAAAGIMNMLAVTRYGYIPETIDEFEGQPNWLTAKKLLWHYVTVFWIFIFIVKGAMLCFFNEFISREDFRSWVVIRLVGVLVFVGGVSSFVYQMLWCLPLSRSWAAGPEYCWFDNKARYRFTLYRQAWHFLLDLIILCIPLPLIPLLKTISLKQKIGIGIMFALGLFCVISSIIFTLGVLQWDHGTLESNEAGWFLYYEPIVEFAAAIMIQCVPALRYLLTPVKKRPSSTRSRGVLEICDSGSTGKTGNSSDMSSAPITKSTRNDSNFNNDAYLKPIKENLVTVEPKEGASSPGDIGRDGPDMFSIEIVRQPEPAKLDV